MRFFQGAVGVIETSHTCRANQCRNHKNVCILWVAGWQPGKVSTKDTLSPISYTTMASIVLSGYSIRNVLVWYVYIYIIYLCRIWYKDVHHQTSSIQKWCGNLQVDCRSSLKPLSSRGSIIHVAFKSWKSWFGNQVLTRNHWGLSESLGSLLVSLYVHKSAKRVGYATTYVLPGTGRALEDETLHWNATTLLQPYEDIMFQCWQPSQEVH